MMVENCFYPAFMAEFEVKQAKALLTELKGEIAKKATDNRETATLELKDLCEHYISAIREYEHLCMLNDAFLKQEAKEGKKK